MEGILSFSSIYMPYIVRRTKLIILADMKWLLCTSSDTLTLMQNLSSKQMCTLLRASLLALRNCSSSEVQLIPQEQGQSYQCGSEATSLQLYSRQLASYSLTDQPMKGSALASQNCPKFLSMIWEIGLSTLCIRHPIWVSAR